MNTALVLFYLVTVFTSAFLTVVFGSLPWIGRRRMDVADVLCTGGWLSVLLILVYSVL